MRKIKLFIFDLDGTLVDAYAAIIKSFNYCLEKTGYPRRSAKVIRRCVGWGDENLLKPFLKPTDLKKALSIYRKHHKYALLRRSRLFPGAKTILKTLKYKNFKIAVASNRPTKFSRILIRHLKIEKFFDYVLSSDVLEHRKPHPEILNKIMHKLKAKPDESVYVGDMAIDAQAGRRAGIKTIIVTTGSSSRSEIKKEKPYRIIKNLRDVSIFVNKK